MREKIFCICLAVLMPSVSLFAEETADFYSEDEAIFHEIEARESEPVSTVLTVSETPYELTMTKEAEKTAAEFYFEFSVDESLFGLCAEIESDAELSLFINHESNEVDLKAQTDRKSGKASVSFSRFEAPLLADGVYYGVVVYQAAAEEEAEVPFRLTLKPQPFVLTGTAVADSAVEWKSGGGRSSSVACYEIELPPDAEALRADVFRCESDVDLYLFAGKPDYRLDRAAVKGETYAGCETVLLDSTTKPPFRADEKYFLMIYDRHPSSSEATVSFAVSASREPAYAARRAMTLPTPDENPAVNAIGATVEILCEQSTGTGFVISPKGYILTALHVLKRADGTYSKSIVGAVNTDVRKAAEERFRLTLVDSDEEKDIALLKIDSMLFGNFPSESGLLPSFSISSRSNAQMGDTLFLIGYPKSGGTGSKNSVKMARGIFSGYENRNGIGFIISDIKADSGNSGGPVVDSLYRIVGISQSLLQSDYSYLLVVYPIDALPSSWLELIRDDR